MQARTRQEIDSPKQRRIWRIIAQSNYENVTRQHWTKPCIRPSRHFDTRKQLTKLFSRQTIPSHSVVHWVKNLST